MSCAPQTVSPFGPAVPANATPTLPTGRARALDFESKRAIALLVTQGYSLSAAAAYMACDRKTVYNERRRDEHFDFNIQRAFAMRTIDPLNVVQQAAKSHWRAAARLVDREEKRLKERKRDRGRQAARQDPAGASPASPAMPAELAVELPVESLMTTPAAEAAPKILFAEPKVAENAGQNAQSARRSARARRRRAKRRLVAVPTAVVASPGASELPLGNFASRPGGPTETASPQALTPPSGDRLASHELPQHWGNSQAVCPLSKVG